jgi:hypothetical protein
LPGIAIDHALDPIPEVGDVEFDQEADSDAAEPHVGEQLGLVNGMDCLNAFHLDNDKVLDQQVYAISKFDPLALVNDAQSDLAGNVYALLPKFVQQAGVIGTFEQAWAQHGMDFHGCRHNLASDVVNARRDLLRESSHESPIPQLGCLPL